ncbi:hypothetical protein MY4824_006144 [Beauveria thailandica]
MKSKRAQEVAAGAEGKPVEAHDDAAPLTKKRKRSGDEVEHGGKKAKKARKDKKDKKDKKKKKGDKESRKDKKFKRKNLQDLPGEGDNDAEAGNGDVNGQPAAKKKDKSKYNKNKDKKNKKDKEDKEGKEDEETPKEKSKKDKKTSSSDATTVAAAPEDAIPDGASNGIDLDVEDAGAAAAAEDKDDKAARHIVFVGNLPYTATAASISAHFASLSPIAVRCLTQKGGDPSHTCKGIAFVEFANATTQRTCLDRFHHSEFDDGHSPARKINVELTAGGGGKSENRTEKIREKNRKLDDNRAKRIEKEKAAKNSDGSSGGGSGGGGGGGESGTMEEQQEHMDEQVHPSRRAQMGSDAPAEDNFQNGSGGGGGRRGGWGGRGRGGGGGRGRGGRGGGGRGRGGWSR